MTQRTSCEALHHQRCAQQLRVNRHHVLTLVFAVTLKTSAYATRECHSYQGDLGDGVNLGPPVAAMNESECCSACLAEVSCGAWTFTVAGSAACYLHPGPGRSVNSGSAYTSGVCSDDDDMFGDIFALRDAPGTSGVPLGGIGTGFFDLAPDGGIARVAINNHHQDGVITDANATFLAVFRASTGSHLLQRRPSIAAGPNLPAAAHTVAVPDSGTDPVRPICKPPALSYAIELAMV